MFPWQQPQKNGAPDRDMSSFLGDIDDSCPKGQEKQALTAFKAKQQTQKIRVIDMCKSSILGENGTLECRKGRMQGKNDTEKENMTKK